MAASEFRIYGPAIDADSAYVNATVDGIGYDGTVMLTDGDNRYSLKQEELQRLRDDDLIMSGTDVENANKELVSALDDIDGRLTKAADAGDYGNFARQRAEDSLREMFRAAVESAK